MRCPFLLSALLLACAVAPASAQERPPLTPDQEAALYGLPVFITAGGTLLLLNVAEEHDAQLLILAMPLVAGATACGAGRLTARQAHAEAPSSAARWARCRASRWPAPATP